MKIGHLIHLDGPGGGPEAIINLARELHNAGDEQVVFHGGEGRLSAFCDSLKIPRVRLAIDRKTRLLYGFPGLVGAFRRAQPDVVLLHGQWAGPVGALAAACAGVRTIYVTHWPAFYTDWTPFRAWRNAWAEWIPCKLARRVIALSPSVYYQYLFRGWASEDKLVILPNVFNPVSAPGQAEAARVRRDFGWDNSNIHVVSVGRLADQKRVDWLLKAWREVQQQCPSARLWIVGEGPERGSLETMALNLGITETCRFLGAQPHGIEFMAAADIVAITSLYEACPFVPLEALACGKPVIATAADGIRDIILDQANGRLVLPGDIQALARSIVGMIGDPEMRARLGQNATLAVANINGRATMEQYRSLIAAVAKKP